MDKTKVSILRDGSREATALVAATMMTLEDLLADQPIVFFELVTLAREPSHDLWGNSADVLRRRALLDQSRRIHGSTKTIIRNAVVGDGLNMRLRNPVAALESVE